MLQYFTDKIGTTLKTNGIDAYSVHVMFPKFTKQFCRYFIDHGHTLVGLLLASTLENTSDRDNPHESFNVGNLANSFVFSICGKLPVCAPKDTKFSRLSARREATQKILAPLTSASAFGFHVTISGTRWKCHPIVLSYCCITTGGKDISGMKYESTAFLCIRCLIRKENVSNLTKGTWRLQGKMDVTYTLHNEFLDVVDAIYRRAMECNCQHSRVSLCLAMDQNTYINVGFMLYHSIL